MMKSNTTKLGVMITNVWPETIRHVQPILMQTTWNVLVHKRPITYTALQKLKVNLISSELSNVYPKADCFYCSRLIPVSSLNLFRVSGELIKVLLAGTSRIYDLELSRSGQKSQAHLQSCSKSLGRIQLFICPLLLSPASLPNKPRVFERLIVLSYPNIN